MARTLRQNFVAHFGQADGSWQKKRRKAVRAGSPAFTKELTSAIAGATRDAIAQHHKHGNPVYVTDRDGNLCELLPDKSLRKLSQSELDTLL